MQPPDDLRGVIFDLDQTLVDSSSLEPLRRAREWSAVYTKVKTLTPYDGIEQVLEQLRQIGLSIGVVTSSPRPYCSRVLQHFSWGFDACVCYHDTSKHKPHPDPIEKALTQMKVEPFQAIALGDNRIDILAARRAGVYSLAALWVESSILCN